jgi:hypothetical protein
LLSRQICNIFTQQASSCLITPQQKIRNQVKPFVSFQSFFNRHLYFSCSAHRWYIIVLFCFLGFLLSVTSLELRAQQVRPDRYIDSITKRTGHLTVSCGVDGWLKTERKSPEFLANEMKMNQEILETHSSNDTLTLPLVIHVVHPTLNSNFISDQQITDAIKGLNEAFSKSGK